MSGLDRKLAREHELRIRGHCAEVQRMLGGQGGQMGQTLTRGGRRGKPIRNAQTGEVYSSVRMAARAMGLNKNAIYQAVERGQRAGGCRWDYA